MNDFFIEDLYTTAAVMIKVSTMVVCKLIFYTHFYKNKEAEIAEAEAGKFKNIKKLK